MISRILSAIRTALASSVRALCAWGDDVMSMPWNVLQAVRDAVYGAPPPTPVIEDVEAAGPRAKGPVAQRRDMVERGLLPLDLEPGPDGVDPLGEAVWRYASEPKDRGTVDLRKLSPDQTRWLLGLDDLDLQRLSEAGRRVCSKLVRGKRVSHLIVAPCQGDEGMACWSEPSPEPTPNVVPFSERLRRISRPVDRQPEFKLAM